MPIDLYYILPSPPCRLVQLTAAALGVELNLKVVDLYTGEHLKPAFMKLNPEHTVPTIQDGDLVLWESRAIIAYLVNKYGKGDLYYPKDPLKRAIVDQRLNFDLGTLYKRFADYYYPQVYEKKAGDPEKYQKLEEALGFFDKFLEGQKYAAGEEISIADFTLTITVSTFVDGGAHGSLAKYPNVQRWFDGCKMDIPGYADSLPSLEPVKEFFAGINSPKVE